MRGRLLTNLPLPLLAALLGVATAGAAVAQDAPPQRNGFALTKLEVPADEILEGGPSRDGIRSVDEPGFAPAADATWVRPENPVLGVHLGGASHVYPVHVIERHQVVNDVVDGEPVVVSYDPLTGSPRAQRRVVDGRTLTFGVSGLVHNHAFLLYDRETESLWVQFTGQAIAGPLAGRRLEPLRIRQETLAQWLARHPDSVVLERPAPAHIDYRYSPFERYILQDDTIFPVKAEDRTWHAKELVLGVRAGGKSRAYLGSFATAAGGRVDDTFQGHPIRLLYDTNLAVWTFEVPDAVRVEEAYWFAWKAFRPDTEVWRPSEEEPPAPDDAAEGSPSSSAAP